MKEKSSNGQLGKFTALISTIVSRADLANRAGITFAGKRDLYKALGYDRTLVFNDYEDRYLRGGIAARIVDAYPMATWRNPPIVTVKNNEDFNKTWKELTERLKMFHYLERIDRVAGVGRYGALFLGVSGAGKPDRVIPKVKGPEGLLFLTVFAESHAAIQKLEGSPTNPRFGLPSEYNVQFLSGTATDSRSTSRIVHASRIIHVVDGAFEDDIFGTPRLRRVWNYLDDLDKVIGGSAEAIWRTVDRGIQFDLDKELSMDGPEEEAMEDAIAEYMHGLNRTLLTKGVTAKVLGSEIPDPRGPVESIMGLISGTTGIPQRILMGSERGELSSGQDERNFNSRVRERQLSYAEPIILRPLLERLILIGALPEPKSDINIEWPDLAVLTDKEAADIAARTGQAIKHVSDQKIMVVPPRVFAVKYLGIDEDDYDKAVAEAKPVVLPAQKSNQPDSPSDDNDEDDKDG